MSAEEGFDPTVIDDVEAAAALWEGGKSVQRSDQPVGTFQAEVADAILGRSQSSDRLQVAWELVLIAGEHKGKVLRKYDGLESEQQVQIFQSGLRQLGVETKDMSFKQLPAVLLSLKGKAVTIRTKQNQDFYNIYFQRAISKVKAGATPGPNKKGKF